MNDREMNHFEMLSAGPCVSSEYVSAYYGVSWPLREYARPDYELWLSQRNRRHQCVDSPSRFDIEGFMEQKGIVPKKWMAARLGMTVESLDELFDNLDKIGMRKQRYVIYQELIAESFSEDIVPNLPGLKFRTFSDHNAFCQRLHADLKAVMEMNVAPLYCATSERVEDYPKQFASNFDCLTLLPLSGKHQMWLDFRKPLNLYPDRCSKLLYAENRELLQPYCVGTREPEDIAMYTEFLAGQHNG